MPRRQPITPRAFIGAAAATAPAARMTAMMLVILAVGVCVRDVRADMMADSPVISPDRGALPAKYSPDRRSPERETPEEGYHIFTTPERSLGQIAKIQAEMPKGTFAPPTPDWSRLPRTRRCSPFWAG